MRGELKSEFQYEVTLTNDGPEAAKNAEFLIEAPSGITLEESPKISTEPSDLEDLMKLSLEKTSTQPDRRVWKVGLMNPGWTLTLRYVGRSSTTYLPVSRLKVRFAAPDFETQEVSGSASALDVEFVARAEAPVGAAGRESGVASGAVFSDFPLYFIENRGQMDEQVSYYLAGRETSVYFTPRGVTYALTGRAGQHSEAGGHAVSHAEAGVAAPLTRWAVKLDFLGADGTVVLEGGSRTPAVVSYFKGPAGTNQTGISTFSKVTYRNLWPGIDLTYSGTVNRLKYQFVVHPGADLTQIRLAYRGAAVVLNDAGQLEVSTPLGSFRDDKPYVFQQRDGRATPVPAAYQLERSDTSEHIAYSFELGDYDAGLPLIIDPSVLIYAGYIGGTSFDTGHDVAVDTAGNAYVTGETAGTAGFPTTVGPDLSFNGDTDAFVAKVNAAGTGLVYAGYIGGNEPDAGESIAIDAAGNAYITGATSSSATTFPT